jgi:hypothetical protein
MILSQKVRRQGPLDWPLGQNLQFHHFFSAERNISGQTPYLYTLTCIMPTAEPGNLNFWQKIIFPEGWAGSWPSPPGC